MSNHNSKLEALLLSIANLNGTYKEPTSDSFKLCNPLLIKSFGAPGAHQVDERGRRVFTSFLSGFRACYYDIELKVKGESRAKLKPTDQLQNLLRVYGLQIGADKPIVSFLRRALNDDSISASTPLSYFLETKQEAAMEN